MSRWKRFTRWLFGSSRKAQRADRWLAYGNGLHLAIEAGLSDKGRRMLERYHRHGRRWRKMRGNRLLSGTHAG